MAYVLFPLPDVCRSMARLPIPVRIEVDRSRRIVLELPVPEQGGIVYYLDSHLEIQEMRTSDNFAPLHERLFRQGLLDHRLGKAELAALGKPIRFIAAPDGNSPRLKELWGY